MMSGSNPPALSKPTPKHVPCRPTLIDGGVAAAHVTTNEAIAAKLLRARGYLRQNVRKMASKHRTTATFYPLRVPAPAVRDYMEGRCRPFVV
jgi:hypothetical protein